MIRAMTPADWPQVAAIYEQGLSGGTSTFNTVCPTWEEWDKSHLPQCRFVTEEQGVVTGWAAISPTSSRPVYRGVVEVSIYIHQDWRGQGVGKQLLSHLCCESEKEGFWTLYVSIFAVNKASLALHETCGFRRIGYREKISKDRFGVWQDTIIMERRSKIIV